jgi:hypothetical protein
MAVVASVRVLEQLVTEAEQRPAGIGAGRTPGLVIVITDGRPSAPASGINAGLVIEHPKPIAIEQE